MAPLISQAIVEGLLTPLAIHQLECYESAITFARTEGLICAPETSHAIAATIREAKKAKEEGKEKVIIFNFSGHGLLDLAGYKNFLAGNLEDYPLPDEEMKKSLKSIEGLPKPKEQKTGKW
jgi:tryptophan synthase beta chain